MTLFERANQILNDRHGEKGKMGADVEALADAVEELIFEMQRGLAGNNVTIKDYPDYTAERLKEVRSEKKNTGE